MIHSIFKDLHGKRVQSLANYTVGAMHARSAAIHAIGTAYAEIAQIKPKHGIKQADRYLSNKGIDVESLTPAWAKFVIGSRKELLLVLDWTEFDPDDQATLCAYLATQQFVIGCILVGPATGALLRWPGRRTRNRHSPMEHVRMRNTR